MRGLALTARSRIWLHLATALAVLGLGTANLTLAKGTTRNRIVGWIWVAAMLFATLSSFWIQELNPSGFSWIHALSAWTLCSMLCAIIATHTGRVKAHAGFMVGTMAGAIVADRV